jgi:hypothetical protein
MQQVAVGCAAGFAGDRIDAGPAVAQALAASGMPSYLIYETLAERTLALAQLRRRAGGVGYLPNLDEFLAPVLALCLERRIPIIGNFGAADPLGAARHISALAQREGCAHVRVAAVRGDDVLSVLTPAQLLALEIDPPAQIEPERLVSANAYLGARGIAQALAEGADIVVTGRVADPALALGPLMHAFGWEDDAWDKLALGTLAGHLLECGAQVTGGYFMEPGVKPVPGAANLGYPIAEVSVDGSLVITKPRSTGGAVTEQTVKEQLLYEIHDPAAYLTPDVTLDLTEVTVSQEGVDRVRVRGARGHARPAQLKVTVCHDGGWLGEGEISYGGPNCVGRGRLAIAILKARLAQLSSELTVRADLIGVASLFNDDAGTFLDHYRARDADDVRVRLAVRAAGAAPVRRAMQEVEALYTTGPAGGSGVRTSVTPILQSSSTYVDRDLVQARVEFVESA